MNIIYTGDVYLITKRHKYHYKNAGTDVLFKLLVSVLTESSISRNALPAYIQLRTGKADASTVGVSPIRDGCLFNPIIVSKHMDLKNTRNSRKWTTVITGTLLPDNIINDLTEADYHLALLDGDKYPLAVINLNNVSIQQLKQGEETLIQWNLSFSNGEL